MRQSFIATSIGPTSRVSSEALRQRAVGRVRSCGDVGKDRLKHQQIGSRYSEPSTSSGFVASIEQVLHSSSQP